MSPQIRRVINITEINGLFLTHLGAGDLDSGNLGVETALTGGEILNADQEFPARES